VLVLDHVNGAKHDWRLENLRLLCPNCNSQTPTFCGRNVRRNH
jgi:5-methylcytosine-specific restriction endonuclease McrA